MTQSKIESSPAPVTDPSADIPAEIRARLEKIWAEAYGAKTRDDLKRLYAQWARSYDEDHAAIGFEGHHTAAAMLARYVADPEIRPVLDAGAGTGAAGEALHGLGFRNVTAIDLSEDMLAVADAKGVYVQSFQADLGEPLDRFPRSHFHAAILVGVFSYGQAPAHALDELVRVVEPGGVIAFTARTDFWEEDAMGVRSRAETLAEDRYWRELEVSEPAPYLPKKDPDAQFRVHVFRVLQADEPIHTESFREAVREAAEKHTHVLRLDHAFIWNSTASRLYNRYTHRKEYYLTDCELEILRTNAIDIVDGQNRLVELGCGSARKIAELLDAATDGGKRVHYHPVDVSEGAIESTCSEVRRRFGTAVELHPETGMFADVLDRLPKDQQKVVLFFGSSIGNLETLGETVDFLRRVRDLLGPNDRFIVGCDLHKDEKELLAAYNAGQENLSFFLNMVRRINDELGGSFDLGAFELGSIYEEEPQVFDDVRSWCVQLRVGTSTPQHVYVRDLDLDLDLEAGDSVQVGASRKFRPEDLAALAARAGMRMTRQWFDSKKWFSLNEMVRDDSPTRGDA